MAQMDQFHNINPGIAIPVDEHTAGITLGNALTVDTLGYESITFIVSTGDVQSNGEYVIKIYESDEDVTGSYVQVTNYPTFDPFLVNLLGVIDLGGGNGYGVRFNGDEDYFKMIKFAYIGKKRYLRLVLGATNYPGGGDTPDLTFGVMALLGNPLDAPTPDTPHSVNP